MKKMIGFTLAVVMTVMMAFGTYTGTEQIAGDDDYGNMFTYTLTELQAS